MSQATPLEGLHAVVSGGGSGLGLATARALHEAGAPVAVLVNNAGTHHKAPTLDTTPRIARVTLPDRRINSG